MYLEAFCSGSSKGKRSFTFRFRFIFYVLLNRTLSQDLVRLFYISFHFPRRNVYPLFISFTVKYASPNVIRLSFFHCLPPCPWRLNWKKRKKKKTFCPPPSALKCSDQLYLLPHESQGEDNLRRVTIVGGQVIFFNLVGQKRQARLDNRHFWASPAGEPCKVTLVQIFKLAGFDSFSRLKRSPPSQQKALLRYGS